MQTFIDSAGSVKDYVAGFGAVLGSASRQCPRCGGHMTGHGRRWRWVVSLEGVQRIPIQRLICKVCRRTVSLLPRILFAFRQCTRKLAAKIRSLWDKSRRSMLDVWYLLTASCAALESWLALPSLYRWCTHTD